MYRFNLFFSSTSFIILAVSRDFKIRIEGMCLFPSPNFNLYHSTDIVFWTSPSKGRKIKPLLNSNAFRTAVLNYNTQIMFVNEYPSMHLFFAENMTGFKSNLYQVNLLFELCRNWTDLDSTYLETFQNTFVFLVPPDQNISAVEALQDLNQTSFTLNSRCYFLTTRSDDIAGEDLLHLYELFYVKTFLKFPLVAVDTWEKLQIILTEPVAPRRMNFQLVEVIALGYCSGSYPEECSWDNETQSFIGGSAVDVFRDLKKSLNFSETSMNSNGYISANGLNETLYQDDFSDGNSSATSTQLLLQEQVDVFISTMVHTPKLPMFFALPHPTFQFGIIAFFEQPLHTRTNIFIAPFKLVIWRAVVYFWSLVAVAALGFIVVERFYLNETDSQSSVSTLFEIASDVAFSTVACICQRGLAALSLLFRLRYVFTAALFASILWNAAYQAGFVSTLAVHESPIRSFQQLLEGEYQFLVNGYSPSLPSYARNILQSMNVSSSRLGYIENYDEALISMSQRTFALIEYFDTFHGFLKYTDFLRNQNPDDYFCQALSAVLVDQRLLTSGMVLPKHSPFKEHFNIKIIQLKELGFNFKYQRTYDRSTQPSCLPRQHFWTNLDLRDVNLAFIILIYASFMSVGFLVIEILSNKFFQ